MRSQSTNVVPCWPTHRSSVPGPPFSVSSPLVSTRTSSPEPPKSVSSPGPPVSTSRPEPPRRTSSPDPPLSTSLPDPPRRTSSPSPPRSRSLPASPRSSSLPANPSRESLPARPNRTSRPGVPRSTSLPAVPVWVQAAAVAGGAPTVMEPIIGIAATSTTTAVLRYFMANHPFSSRGLPRSVRNACPGRGRPGWGPCPSALSQRLWLLDDRDVGVLDRHAAAGDHGVVQAVVGLIRVGAALQHVDARSDGHGVPTADGYRSVVAAGPAPVILENGDTDIGKVDVTAQHRHRVRADVGLGDALLLLPPPLLGARACPALRPVDAPCDGHAPAATDGDARVVEGLVVVSAGEGRGRDRHRGHHRRGKYYAAQTGIADMDHRNSLGEECMTAGLRRRGVTPPPAVCGLPAPRPSSGRDGIVPALAPRYRANRIRTRSKRRTRVVTRQLAAAPVSQPCRV